MNQSEPQPKSATDPDRMVTEVRYEFTPRLPEILDRLQASVMVTTYQAGKLLVLGVHDGQLKISFNSFDQPMGLAVDDQRLALGTRREIHYFRGNREVAPAIEPAGAFDLCFVPRGSAGTGNIHGHDLAWGNDGLWAVNTLFSCLCTLHEDYSFVPRWRPRFITQLIDQDRCHLNGLAVVNGIPKYVTAMAETDTAHGWRPNKATSGVLMDVESGETVARGFAMPHSPRWHDGRLWVLDSGFGALCVVDRQSGRRETVATFPGYTRGLSFLGQFAFVGLSRIRETSVFGGVPIAEHRDELKCGVGVVDITTGHTVAVFQFLSGVTEIFAVEVVAASRCPLVAGASADGRERDVWIVPRPGHLPESHADLPWYARGMTGKPQLPAAGAVGFTASQIGRPASSSVPAISASPATTSSALSSDTTQPIDANGWVTLGNQRQEQSRQHDAMKCYERALQADPDSVPARQNLGYLQFNLGMPEAAQATYQALLARHASPLNRLLAASVLPIVYDSTEHLSAWRDQQTAALRQIVDQGEVVDATTQLVPTAFFWPYQGLNDVEIMRLRGQIIRGHAAPRSVRTAAAANGRIRVGFLSAYLRDHTIGRLNIGRVEQLDRRLFEVTVCLASIAQDAFVERFRRSADHFLELPRDLRLAAEQLHLLDLDILVFCDVGMDALCSTLAYSRFAPVQCAAWGHPETTGSPAIDSFLSSELLETPDGQNYYSEQLVLMPLTGTFYERPQIPTQPTDPATLISGVPAGATIYSCPQSLFKFHPDFDDVLRQILERDPRGILVVIEGRVPEWTRRLQHRWQRTMPGVIDRIRWVPSLPNPEFLKLLSASHVILDPLHFGGGNSSYEALACSIPIVTLPGPFLRSRITAAMYQKMGLSHLVVGTSADYVDRAVQWGTDSAARQHVVASIRKHSGVLFSDAEEVRCLERTLRRLHDAACRDQDR